MIVVAQQLLVYEDRQTCLLGVTLEGKILQCRIASGRVVKIKAVRDDGRMRHRRYLPYLRFAVV